MKKQTKNLLIFAGVGAVAYFLLKNKGASARMIESEAESAQTKETAKEAEKMPEMAEVDAVIDTAKTGQTVKQAIDSGKKLAETLKDANIVIKTPKGMPNISIKKGGKKTSRRKQLRKESRTKRRLDRLKGKAKKTEQKSGKLVSKRFKNFKMV